MFFEKDALSFNILDVIELKQKNVIMLNSGRNFNAISFRYRSDAVLKTKTEEYRMSDYFVSYVPARLIKKPDGASDVKYVRMSNSL